MALVGRCLTSRSSAATPSTSASAAVGSAPCRTRDIDQRVRLGGRYALRTSQTLIVSLAWGLVPVLRSGFSRQLVTRPHIGYTSDKFCYRWHLCAAHAAWPKTRRQALLWRVRVATARALPSMRFRERAHREVLRWLRQADRADRRFEAGDCARVASFRWC
jgi:hypothetical protein